MNRLIVALLGIGLVVSVIAISLVGIGIGVYNDCIAQEAGIKAQYAQNKNNYDNYFKKLREVAQVPELYVNDLKSVYASALQGRYGEKGSQAVFQFIKEHNPNFDASLYKEIQQVIQAGRTDFEANQKTLIDKKRVYELGIQTFPRTLFVKFLGFPRIDLTQYDIVLSGETEKVFENKRSEPIQLR